VRASAIVNQCYFADLNSAPPLGLGRSLVVGPEGETVAAAGDGPEILTFQVDLERVRACRENGTLHLNQVLKSLRDSSVEFPQHGGAGIAQSEHWQALGELSHAALDVGSPARAR
jgi:deaminated glutathione amidase